MQASLNIIMVFKSRKMRQVGHVARMGSLELTFDRKS